MKSQFKNQLPALMSMTFASLFMLVAVPVQAADKFVSCERQSTYRLGAPGKGTILRDQYCERVEFAAFERGYAEQEKIIPDDAYTIKVGKPTYNRRPKNR